MRNPIPFLHLTIPLRHVLLAAFLLALTLFAAGCNTIHAYANNPLEPQHLAPDCRASFDITQPRGEKDVLFVLCLSGGGSRAAWFSAAAMMRLEQVADSVNLLHEVDVISSVSGSSLTSAYYCLTRDPGPYSVVRVQQLPDQLPPDLATTFKMDRQRSLLGVRGKMSPQQLDLLLPLFPTPHDQECAQRLFFLSNHTHAPEIWRPRQTRELLTRNYINELILASFSPLNFWDDILYWTTAFDRSDQLAKIFTRNLFGTPLVQLPEPIQSTAELRFLSYLDRPPADADAAENDDRVLRWPHEPAVVSPVRLDWVPGYSPSQQVAQFLARSVSAGVREVTTPFQPFIPYRFKDLNPERPYLILNSVSATEDDPDGLRFGNVFTFTREDFTRHLNSSIDDYDVARAVTASAAFPGAFSCVTLRDFRPPDPNADPRYLHVFDGGTTDNLGLISAKRVILENCDRYRHILVLLVDSHVTSTGASRTDPDPRNYVVDLNFLQSFDTLLDSVRYRGLAEFNSRTFDGRNLADKLTFWHVSFDDLRDPDLRAQANRIPTSFKIAPHDVDVLLQSANELIRPDHPKLRQFLQVLNVDPTPQPPAPAYTPPLTPTLDH